MKFKIQARLCLAIYDFEVRIMLSLRLTFLPDYRYEKNLTPMWLQGRSQRPPNRNIMIFDLNFS